MRLLGRAKKWFFHDHGYEFFYEALLLAMLIAGVFAILVCVGRAIEQNAASAAPSSPYVEERFLSSNYDVYKLSCSRDNVSASLSSWIKLHPERRIVSFACSEAYHGRFDISVITTTTPEGIDKW